MQNRSRALLAVICLSALTTLAYADDKKDIAALYAKLAKAMTAKDMKGVMSTCAPGFTYTAGGRTATGDQLSAQMQQQFAMIKGSPKTSFTITSCAVKGKTATVTSTTSTELTMPMQDGKPHKIVQSGKSKDLLVKTEKGWLMKTVGVLSNSMTIDGKPFDPTKPQGAAK